MSELATQIGEIAETINAFKAGYGDRLGHLEKLVAQAPANDWEGSSGRQSLGEMVVSDEAVQALKSNFRGKTTVKITGDRAAGIFDESAAITSANTTVGAGRSASTSLIPGHRLETIVGPSDRRLTIRDLLPQGRTTSNMVEWPRETSFTNAARPVEETTAKPYSDLGFNMTSSPVRTIAHMFKASRQLLDDAPAMQAYIDRRGRYGLKWEEEFQLLKADGTNQNILGLIPQATPYAAGFVTQDATPIDVLNQAASQAEDAEISVTGIVLNRRDWRRIMGTKTADGSYISPDSPFGVTPPRLWNLPVVATNAISPGKFLVGAFEEGAQIFDRMDVEVLISTENEDDFAKNMVSFRIEERLALAVFRPAAFIYGDLG